VVRARIVAAAAAQRTPMSGRKADTRASRRRGSYISGARCATIATKKKEEKHRRKKEIDRLRVAAARMTINLHRITMHVSIKKLLDGKMTILRLGIPCPDKNYSANSRDTR